jgi:hypothetical protein
VRLSFVAPASSRLLFLLVVAFAGACLGGFAAPRLGGAISGSSAAPDVLAQNPDLLLPEQSAAKAKELIQQTIRALGGDAYLNVKDMTRTGRLATFDSKGELSGYVKFWDFVKLTDKNRTEYGNKRNVIDVFSGDKAWTLDRGGVQEQPTDRIERFQEGLKKDMDILLRFRLKEEGMVFRWGGSEIIDLKRVDLVDIVDKERRTTRVAIEQSTKLPMRVYYITRDRERRSRVEEVEYLANYQTIQGIETPLQQTRYRNDKVVFQVFFATVQYNTGLGDDFFTKEALDQVWAKLKK